MLAILYSKTAIKALRKIPQAQEQRIRASIDKVAANPRDPSLDIKAMVGEPYLRLRVGDYRVTFTEDGKVLRIVKIGPRGSVYKK